MQLIIIVRFIISFPKEERTIKIDIIHDAYFKIILSIRIFLLIAENVLKFFDKYVLKNSCFLFYFRYTISS